MIIVNVSEEYYEKVKEKNSFGKNYQLVMDLSMQALGGGLLPINTFNK